MTKQVTRAFEFDNNPVTFLVTPNEVLVNAIDLLNIEYADVLIGTDEELFATVFEHLHSSDYDHHWCVIDTNDKKRIIIWLREEFAIQFAGDMSNQLAKWCKNRFKKLNNQKCEILNSEEIKPQGFYEIAKEPALDEYYECDSSDKPHEGLTQTFLYRNDPISLCCDENEVLVNTTQMLRIFKKERKEWLALKSTDSVEKACAARGQTIASSYGSNKDSHSIWSNITLAEHLALWLEKQPDLKLWLQDRAEELKFFTNNANCQALRNAHCNIDFLRTNCIINRD